MYCQGRDDHSLHRHGGWLHFVGELEAEIDTTERIGECMLFWLIRHTALLPAAFRRQLRPMRGLKSVASAAIFARGHDLMRNIRRRFYRAVEAVPQRLVLAWTWNRLAEAV